MNNSDNDELSSKELGRTIRPIVLKQLKNVINEVGAYTLDSKPLYIFTIVGRVMSIIVYPSIIKYTIEDGTGVCTFVFNYSEYDTNLMHQTIEVDKYVRVYGRCSVSYQLDSFGVNIALITDFNEVSFHVIGTIYHYLNLNF